MATYRMKIRDLYIEPLKNETKKHEFRLNDDDRKNIRIGDYLILCSKQNKDSFVKVIVTGIEHYYSWEEIIEKYWETEFVHFFDSKERMIKEVYNYYTKEEINKNGILCYKIKKYTTPILKGSSVLLDTNVFIDRESGTVESSIEIQHMFKKLDELKCTKSICKQTIEELSKYKNYDSKKVF